MRKIEKLMIEAVMNKQDFRLDNTEAYFLSASETGNPFGSRSEVYLDGHLIAEYWHDSRYTDRLQVDTDTLSKYPSNTTLSRLRALGADITVKKGDVLLDGRFIVNRRDVGY